MFTTLRTVQRYIQSTDRGRGGALIDLVQLEPGKTATFFSQTTLALARDGR